MVSLGRHIEPRLTIESYCAKCPALELCVSAFSDDQCWDAAGYPVAYEHPGGTHRATHEFKIPSAAVWGRIPTNRAFLPVSKARHAARLGEFISPLSEMGLGSKGAQPAIWPLALLAMGQDESLDRFHRNLPQIRRHWKLPVIGPCYSTWDDMPPFQHIVSALRTMADASFLGECLPVVPAIPFSGHIDSGLYRDLLIDGQASDVAADLAKKTPDGWLEVARHLERLRKSLAAEDLRLIAHGVSTTQKIVQVVEIWGPNVLFVSRLPVDLGLRGVLLDAALSRRVGTQSAIPDLVPLNVATFEATVRRLLRRSLPRPNFKVQDRQTVSPLQERQRSA